MGDTNWKWQCSEFVGWAKWWKCKAMPSAVVEHVLENGGVMVEVFACLTRL
jgi:hypothetical protein